MALLRNKIVLVLLATVLLMSSCAIHRKFPFICFRKECVLSQLGFYAAKESFKRAKINATVRRHKREVKRNVRAGRKGTKPPYDLEKERKQTDSLTYTGGFSGLCKELKIVFISEKKDTIIAHYGFDDKDLKTAEKQLIAELVKTLGAGAVTGVVIINCHKRSVLSDHEASWMDERARKIKIYLEKTGIPKNKVSVEE